MKNARFKLDTREKLGSDDPTKSAEVRKNEMRTD